LGDAFLIGPEAVPSQVTDLVGMYREACARHGRTPASIAVRRDVHVGADDADAQRVAGPIAERGYRGFDPEAPVAGGPVRVAAAFADLGAPACSALIIRPPADDRREVRLPSDRP